jgi:hypothetical protein
MGFRADTADGQEERISRGLAAGASLRRRFGQDPTPGAAWRWPEGICEAPLLQAARECLEAEADAIRLQLSLRGARRARRERSGG